MSLAPERLPAAFRRATLLAVLCVTSVQCSYEWYGCADTLYVPVGPIIKDRCECVDGVPFVCLDGCEGDFALTCEPPDALAAFFNGDCKTCYLSDLHKAYSNQCELHH